MRKFIKNQTIEIELHVSCDDVVTKEAPPRKKKKRSMQYNTYDDQNCRKHFHFLIEKFMMLKQQESTMVLRANESRCMRVIYL